MTLNGIKLGRAVTFAKYLASVVSLIFLTKTLIWNKITFPASNSLNFAELMENELMKRFSEMIFFFFLCSVFLSLSNLSLLIVKILRAFN